MNYISRFGAACAIFACVLCQSATPLPIADADADAGASLARAMREAHVSDGFEVRMSVSILEPDGDRRAPYRVAVVGQASGDGGWISVRPLVRQAGQAVNVVARLDAEGAVRAVRLNGRSGAPAVAIDPYADRTLDGLSVWEMLSPWWQWPQQTLQGETQIAGRTCSLITSRATPDAIVRSVASCVDTRGRIALRTDLLDARGERLRRIEVTQVIRNARGSLNPKRILITEPGRAGVELDLYAGDEHYVVDREAFPALNDAGFR